MKRLDDCLFDAIAEKAEVSERKRMHYDLRTSVDEKDWSDMSQRILNVLMKDTVIPIHRHMETNEVVIVMRGEGYEITYDDDGKELDRVMLAAGSKCTGVVVSKGTWHTFVALDDGTTIFEVKDRPYDPISTEEFLKI